MLQLPAEIELLGIGLLTLGVIFLIAAFLSLWADRKTHDAISTEHKGVILIGPIPIVWGYGKKGWLLAFLVAFTLWVILIFVF
ncbi:MAG: DUF131 domain-containing protein [Candidatus Thorarchaeota archaeon]|nr:DUF131 domain-containing protein [Candidatus Thorarchaeota archaeon]